MHKWYDEEYAFTIEVTGFLRGDHTEGYCRNGEEIGDRYACAYGCPVNAQGQGIKACLWAGAVKDEILDMETLGCHLMAYLGANYGSTLTPAAAKKYCPPTWQDWYNKVANQMNRI